MRKRIKELAKGKFEYAKPELLFSKESIEISVLEGQDLEGEFTISTAKHRKIRGIIYSTSPRMEVLNSKFEGETVRIRYQFHSFGLSEGMTERGDFVIVCEQNEIRLSFCASISQKYADTSIGLVKNLYDFACLAKSNWNEAFQLFYNKHFSNIMKSNETKELMLYRSMIGAKPSNQNMEEFLIGIRKKEKVLFDIEKTKIELRSKGTPLRESIEIRKNNWGYFALSVITEGDFIHVEKTRITAEDFSGSIYQLEFSVDSEELHAGKNFGSIRISSAYETRTIEVMVNANKAGKALNPQYFEKKRCRAEIMELYQAYRLKRIVTGVWASESIKILDRLHKLEPKEPMYPLLKAQCLIMNRQKQEAEWILDEFKREWSDKESVVWGCYLYLMTLMEKEAVIVERITEEIEDIFEEYPDSPILFWILLFLQEEYYDSDALKLKDIRHWIMEGCASPYLYVEAFYLMLQNPNLITKLGAFEVRVLRWAARHGALTKDIAILIFQLMETQKGFYKVLYELMCAAYEVNPKSEYIGSICGYLIKGQRYEHKYHYWYARGIEEELRITSLYEAYLLSMDERCIEDVPKVIQMYFQYESNLPYKKMAVLYNNVIASKGSNPEIYQGYSRSMSRFAMEQILEGHMDDNLAVVYDDVLDFGMINEKMAKALANIIFAHKVIVFDDKMVRAIIYQPQLREPQVVSIINHAAYFQLYSTDYVIVFEDAKGQRYSSSMTYQLQSLMDARRYLGKCMELAPLQLPYLIAYFDTRKSYRSFGKQDRAYFQPLMFSDMVSGEYKARILPEILRFYRIHVNDGMVEEYLLKADYGKLDVSSRTFVLSLLVEYELFDLAYELLMTYGIDQIGSGARLVLASHMVEKTEYEEEAFLIKLAFSAFQEKKYNHCTLKYLCMYFQGPTQEMFELWNAAREYEVERFELSERILVQQLYAEERSLETMPVFAYFYKIGGEDILTLAYVSECAHRYFVGRQKIHEDIFALIEARYIYHFELNDICKLALLQHYSEVDEVTERQLAMEDELLAEYTRRNMYFAFYKRLHPEMQLKYHLYDKVFLEYRTSPKSHVVLHYSRDEDGDNFIKEDMADVYDGIFVKAFVMFFGEVIQYYISEVHGSEVEVTKNNRIVNNDIFNKQDESRYNLLNQMLISHTLQEEEELYRIMEQYENCNQVTKKVFKLL